MSELPRTLDELDNVLTSHLDDEPRVIVAALCALTRRVCEQVPDAPSSVAEALGILDAWCSDTVPDEALDAAVDSLNADAATLMASDRPTDSLSLIGMTGCIARKAMYEDDDDWPSDVAVTAVELYIDHGQREADAVEAVARVLAEHGLL